MDFYLRTAGQLHTYRDLIGTAFRDTLLTDDRFHQTEGLRWPPPARRRQRRLRTAGFTPALHPRREGLVVHAHQGGKLLPAPSAALGLLQQRIPPRFGGMHSPQPVSLQYFLPRSHIRHIPYAMTNIP